MIKFLRTEGTTLLLACVLLSVSATMLQFAFPYWQKGITSLELSDCFLHEVKISDSLGVELRTMDRELFVLEQRCVGSSDMGIYVNDAASACELLVRQAESAGIRFVRLQPDPAVPGRLTVEFSEPFNRLTVFIQSIERFSGVISIDDCVMKRNEHGLISTRLEISYSYRTTN